MTVSKTEMWCQMYMSASERSSTEIHYGGLVMPVSERRPWMLLPSEL